MSKSQLDDLKLNASIERERKNESKYFQLFIDLLKQKRGNILTKATSTATTSDQSQSHQHYAEETKILKKLLAAEREAIVGSIVVGSVAFLSVRTFPRLAVRFIGGEARMKSLRESELAAKSAPNAFLKRSGSEYIIIL